MDQSNRLEADRLLRILVVPLAGNNSIDAPLQLLQSIKYQCNHPSWWSTKGSMFKNMRWNNAEVLFEFISDEEEDTSKFQQYIGSKRILGIIGVLDYNCISYSADRTKSSTHISSKILIELEKVKRKHTLRDVVLQKIFLFNYPFDEQAGVQSKLNIGAFPADMLEIFPPASMQEILRAHCAELLGNVAVKLVLALDDQMSHCEASTGVAVASAALSPLSLLTVSPFKSKAKVEMESPKNIKPLKPTRSPLPGDEGGVDVEEAPKAVQGVEAALVDFHTHCASSSSSSRRHLQSFKHGRVRKWMGDLCMQVCSPLDALAEYTLSLAILKSAAVQSEGEEESVVWQAWAHEGIASSILLASDRGLADIEIQDIVEPVEKTKTPTKRSVEERFDPLATAEKHLEEALQLYGKRPHLIQAKVASLCKLAAFVAFKTLKADAAEEPTADEYRTRVAKCVTRAYIVASRGGVLSAHDCREHAALCSSVGLHRKAQLFRFQAEDIMMRAESRTREALTTGLALCTDFGCFQSTSSACYVWLSLRKSLLREVGAMALDCVDTERSVTSGIESLILRVLAESLRHLKAAYKRQRSVGDIHSNQGFMSTIAPYFDAITDSQSVFSDGDTVATPPDTLITEQRLRQLNTDFVDVRLKQVDEDSNDTWGGNNDSKKKAPRSRRKSYSSKLPFKNLLESFQRSAFGDVMAGGSGTKETDVVDSYSPIRFRRAWTSSSMFVSTEEQSEMWRRLCDFLDLLPAAAALEDDFISIRCLPFSISKLDPLSLRSDDRPSPVTLLAAGSSAIADGHKTSLFFDPFTAKSKKAVDVSTCWSTGVLGFVEVLLCNHFAINIKLFDVHAAFEGVDHVAYPSQCVIPAAATGFLLRLAIKPLCEGTLTLKGISFRLSVKSSRRFISTCGEDEEGGPLASPASFPRTAQPKQTLPRVETVIMVAPKSATLRAKCAMLERDESMEIFINETRREVITFKNCSPGTAVVDYKILAATAKTSSKGKRKYSTAVLRDFASSTSGLVEESSPSDSSCCRLAALTVVKEGAARSEDAVVQFEEQLRLELEFLYSEGIDEVVISCEYLSGEMGRPMEQLAYTRSALVIIPVRARADALSVRLISRLPTSLLANSRSTQSLSDTRCITALRQLLATGADHLEATLTREESAAVLQITNNTDNSVCVSLDASDHQDTALLHQAPVAFALHSHKEGLVFIPPKAARNVIVPLVEETAFFWKLPGIPRGGTLLYKDPSYRAPPFLVNLSIAGRVASDGSCVCAVDDWMSLHVTIQLARDSSASSIEVAVFILDVASTCEGKISLSTLLDDHAIGCSDVLVSGQSKKTLVVSSAGATLTHSLGFCVVKRGEYNVCTLVRSSETEGWHCQQPLIIIAE